jgi:hypothetical protein
MADLLVVVGVLAFFALCVLYVAGLDRLVGPDDDVALTGAGGDESRDALAPAGKRGR